MGSPKLAGNAERRVLLAVQETLGKLTLLSEAKDDREGQVVEAMVPVHELLLDGRKDTRASELPRFIGRDADPNFSGESQWRGWDVREVGLETVPQMGVMNYESRAILEPDSVPQPAGTGSLVDHCLCVTLAVMVEETGAELERARAGGRCRGGIPSGRSRGRIKPSDAVLIVRKGGLCVVL